MYYNQCTKDIPEEYLTGGFYFKPGSHCGKHYLVKLTHVEVGTYAKVNICEISNPQENCKFDILENGSDITAITVDAEFIASIELYNKYYFPTFNQELQLYYTDDSYKSDEMTAISEVMNYAIKLGLEKANIKTY